MTDPKSHDDHRRAQGRLLRLTAVAIADLLEGRIDPATPRALEHAAGIRSELRIVCTPIGPQSTQGVVVASSAEVPAQLTPEARAFRAPPPTITAADYQGDRAPSIMELAAQQRAERNRDVRLPRERDE